MRTSLALISALAVGVSASLFSVTASAQALAPSSPQASRGQAGPNVVARSGDSAPRSERDFRQTPQVREVRDFHERRDSRESSRGYYAPARRYNSPRDSFSIGFGFSDDGFATAFSYGRNVGVSAGYYSPRPVYCRPAPVVCAPEPVCYAPAPVVYAPEPVTYYAPSAVYAPAPVVYQQPVVYSESPVVYAPAPIVYQSAPVYYYAAPVTYYAPAPCYRPVSYQSCYPAVRSGVSFNFTYRGGR